VKHTGEQSERRDREAGGQRGSSGTQEDGAGPLRQLHRTADEENVTVRHEGLQTHDAG